MAPIRSNPKLMGFQRGCSQLLGKSRGDRMLGSGPIGREELLTIRTRHTIQRYSPPWAPYKNSDERQLIAPEERLKSGPDPSFTIDSVPWRSRDSRPTEVRLSLTPRSRFLQGCGAYRRRNRAAPPDNRRRAGGGRPLEPVKQSRGISECK
jgi:hypothetical protein